MTGVTAVLLADTVADGALLLALAVAFGAGVVSFLSPCVLPLVPAYLSFVTGLSAAELADQAQRGDDPSPTDERDVAAATAAVDAGAVRTGTSGAAAAAASVRSAGAITAADRADADATPGPALRGVRRRVVLGSLGFVLGAAVVFVSFGALFGGLGDALQEHAVGLSQVFGVVTIALGLFMAGAFERLGFLQRDVRIHRIGGRGLAFAPVLGFTFALGWTPCIGPTLGTVLGLSASTDGATAARGALLSVAYCLGLGVPLLLTGLAFTRAMGLFAVVKRHYRAFMVGGGLSLVVLGVLQVTGVWAAWTSEVQTRFGSWDLPL